MENKQQFKKEFDEMCDNTLNLNGFLEGFIGIFQRYGVNISFKTFETEFNHSKDVWYGRTSGHMTLVDGSILGLNSVDLEDVQLLTGNIFVDGDGFYGWHGEEFNLSFKLPISKFPKMEKEYHGTIIYKRTQMEKIEHEYDDAVDALERKFNQEYMKAVGGSKELKKVNGLIRDMRIQCAQLEKIKEKIESDFINEAHQSTIDEFRKVNSVFKLSGVDKRLLKGEDINIDIENGLKRVESVIEKANKLTETYPELFL